MQQHNQYQQQPQYQVVQPQHGAQPQQFQHYTTHHQHHQHQQPVMVFQQPPGTYALPPHFQHQQVAHQQQHQQPQPSYQVVSPPASQQQPASRPQQRQPQVVQLSQVAAIRSSASGGSSAVESKHTTSHSSPSTNSGAPQQPQQQQHQSSAPNTTDDAGNNNNNEHYRRGYKEGYEAALRSAHEEVSLFLRRFNDLGVHGRTTRGVNSRGVPDSSKPHLLVARIDPSTDQQQQQSSLRTSNSSSPSENHIVHVADEAVNFTDFASGEKTQSMSATRDNNQKDHDDVTQWDSVSNHARRASLDSASSRENGAGAGGGGAAQQHNLVESLNNSLTSREESDNDNDSAAHKPNSQLITSPPPSASSGFRYSGNSNVSSSIPSVDDPMGGYTGFMQTTQTSMGLLQHSPHAHINYLYGSLRDVAYDRFEAGRVFAVALPKTKNASHRIASECLLRTRALDAQRHVLTHCAHYYFNRVCNRGGECCFVHAVSVPEIRVWGKTVDKQELEFVGSTAGSGAAPTASPTAATPVLAQQVHQMGPGGGGMMSMQAVPMVAMPVHMQ